MIIEQLHQKLQNFKIEKYINELSVSITVILVIVGFIIFATLDGLHTLAQQKQPAALRKSTKQASLTPKPTLKLPSTSTTPAIKTISPTPTITLQKPQPKADQPLAETPKSPAIIQSANETAPTPTPETTTSNTFPPFTVQPSPTPATQDHNHGGNDGGCLLGVNLDGKCLVQVNKLNL